MQALANWSSCATRLWSPKRCSERSSTTTRMRRSYLPQRLDHQQLDERCCKSTPWDDSALRLQRVTCHTVKLDMTPALPLLRVVCFVGTNSPCCGDQRSRRNARLPPLRTHPGPPLQPECVSEPTEHPRGTLLGAMFLIGPHAVELTDQPTHCVFLVALDEHGSGLGPSCQPSLGRQLQHALRLSLGAVQTTAVFCAADGLKYSLQLFNAQNTAHLGVFGTLIPLLLSTSLPPFVCSFVAMTLHFLFLICSPLMEYCCRIFPPRLLIVRGWSRPDSQTVPPAKLRSSGT